MQKLTTPGRLKGSNPKDSNKVRCESFEGATQNTSTNRLRKDLATALGPVASAWRDTHEVNMIDFFCAVCTECVTAPTLGVYMRVANLQPGALPAGGRLLFVLLRLTITSCLPVAPCQLLDAHARERLSWCLGEKTRSTHCAFYGTMMYSTASKRR